MANEVITLDGLREFKSKCDLRYALKGESGNTYWEYDSSNKKLNPILDGSNGKKINFQHNTTNGSVYTLDIKTESYAGTNEALLSVPDGTSSNGTFFKLIYDDSQTLLNTTKLEMLNSYYSGGATNVTLKNDGQTSPTLILELEGDGKSTLNQNGLNIYNHTNEVNTVIDENNVVIGQHSKGQWKPRISLVTTPKEDGATFNGIKIEEASYTGSSSHIVKLGYEHSAHYPYGAGPTLKLGLDGENDNYIEIGYEEITRKETSGGEAIIQKAIFGTIATTSQIDSLFS